MVIFVLLWYMQKQLFTSVSVNSARIFTSTFRVSVNREFKLRVSGNRQTADSNFLRKISVKRFHFIFSFLCRKNSHASQF